jgi:hypothetical protein
MIYYPVFGQQPSFHGGSHDDYLRDTVSPYKARVNTKCVCVFLIIKGRRLPAFFLCFQTGSLWGFPFSGFAAIEWGRRGAEPLLSASALSKQALCGRRVRVLSFSWTVKVQSNFVLRAGWAQLGYVTSIVRERGFRWDNWFQDCLSDAKWQRDRMHPDIHQRTRTLDLQFATSLFHLQEHQEVCAAMHSTSCSRELSWICKLCFVWIHYKESLLTMGRRSPAKLGMRCVLQSISVHSIQCAGGYIMSHHAFFWEH